MLKSVLVGSPATIWFVFLALMSLGIRSAQKRESLLVVVYALPLLGLLVIQRIGGMPRADLAIGLFALAYVGGSVAGYVMQSRWIMAKSGARVTLRGEWVTFATLMAIYLGYIGTGLVQGLWPQGVATAGFAIVYGSVTGLVAGSLFGRALRVMLWPSERV